MSQNITISSIHDTEEETNEVFAIRLLAARVGGGGDTRSARVSTTDNAAILTGKQKINFVFQILAAVAPGYYHF